jgi:hypothetical protein
MMMTINKWGKLTRIAAAGAISGEATVSHVHDNVVIVGWAIGLAGRVNVLDACLWDQCQWAIFAERPWKRASTLTYCL